MLWHRWVMGRFGPVPSRTLGHFGPIPFRSGRFGPISEVGGFGLMVFSVLFPFGPWVILVLFPFSQVVSARFQRWVVLA